MNHLREISVLLLLLISTPGLTCSEGDYGHGLDPASSTGFLLSNNPFDLSGVPEILVSGTTGIALEGGRAEFQVRFSRNVAWGLMVNIVSTSPSLSFGGAQSTEIHFPFGDTATARSVVADMGADANFNDDDINIALTSSAVAAVDLQMRSVDTDVSFSSSAAYSASTAPTPISIQVSDLDGDGKTDVAVADSSGLVYVHRNSSSPGFPSVAPSQSIVANSGVPGFNTKSMLLDDLDGDGRDDLTVGGSQNGGTTIRFLRNIGTPGNILFQFPGAFQGTTGAFQEMVAGDLDGDGRPDIAALTGFGSMTVFRNTSTAGAISFASGLKYNVGSLLNTNLAIGDVDGDGQLDLAVPNVENFIGQEYLIVFHNSSTPGNIVLDSRITNIEPSVPGTDTAAALRDMDGDGRLDLIMLREQPHIYLNISDPGDPSFAGPLLFPDSDMYAMSVVDLNGSGRPDMLFASKSSSNPRSITVLRNASSPGNLIMRAPQYLLAAPANNSGIASGDIDGDGLTDFVYFVEGGTSLIHVHRNVTGK